MADIKKRPVTIGVSKLFFKKVFEPERKKFEKQLGVKFSQKNFTEFLAKSNVKFKINPEKDTIRISRDKLPRRLR